LGRGEDQVAAGDAFAAGGFEVISPVASISRDGLAEALADSGALVACVVLGVDGPEAATEAARALRAAGAKVLVAATHSPDGVPSGVFDATLTQDTDLVSLFSYVLDRIAEPGKNGQS
jgi:hypothetical protein